NPSIGGPAKGHLVREIDALGGEMGRNIDKSFVQIRMLNTGKGPAVQALRAQADKKLYGLAMKHTLERQSSLYVKQALIEGLEQSDQSLRVITNTGWNYEGKTVVLTTGTSLAGRVIVGENGYAAGRAGEFAAYGLSESLRNLGFTLGRLKTGTPPRLDAKTINFSKTIIQPGSETPFHFSFTPPEDSGNFSSPNPVYPQAEPTPWRQQIPCYLVYTNERTHEIIRANLHRAPLFTGYIEGTGPRNCPSIEDKIVKFADKPSHPLFLEPEGWETSEVYLQGANTSLPEDVQLEMVRSIPALENAEIIRMGYAIEYDYVPTSQISSTLETKLLPGLFLAGQINGTTGYEEAAGQGLIAGINAALKVKRLPPLILGRDQGYVGVMLDDLVTKELTDPYRLLTSRAEYRLLLRQDNADLRLTPVGYQLGLIEKDRYEVVETKRKAITAELKRLSTVMLVAEKLADALKQHDLPSLTRNVSAIDFIRRSELNYQSLISLGLGDSNLSPECIEQVEIEVKYDGYIRRQRAAVERMQKVEERRIPDWFEYEKVTGLRYEASQKLHTFKPQTLGQASRIDGVTPADMSLLMIHLERARGNGNQNKGETANASYPQ
ncbi:MAG: tRNA uridine-5-carboxymethylaminomethyl(34) synthesis enzyme MnmG, partial [Chloroflexota bacterium]|nr:tRNA uridine-5-carboxymethylaminomethyl(34) synthesis enzyme MnmG [Chloroflexota bacterium]